MKFLLIIFFTISILNSSIILTSTKNINYNETINIDNLKIVNVNQNIRCKIFDIKLLKNDTYIAKHFIFKNKAICEKDVKKFIVNKIEYDFGNILIQRAGKVIGETKQYIKIKDINGKIKKIYKNGQN